MPTNTASPTEIWTEAERRAWAPPELITPPVWAERYRYLSRRQTSRPGQWSNLAAPYLIGIMLMCVRHGVDVLTILKAAQIGVSEAMRCVIGCWAHLQPDPVLLVLPDKESGRTIISDRIIPLFEDTDVLAALATGRKYDQKKSEILLSNGFTLRLGWSGGAMSLASHPARRVVNDERSKFQDGGKEADPEQLGEERTSTYENSLVVNLSTPHEDPDPTAESFDRSPIKLYYFVACPHCGKPQRLVFDRLTWSPTTKEEPDTDRRAARIIHDKSAWMRCEFCPGRITDAQKRAIVENGFWATADLGWRLCNDGHEEGVFPMGTRVGMQISALYSLAAKHTFVRLAAEYVRAEGNYKLLQNFHNSKLGEVLRQQVTVARASIFASKSRPDPLRGFNPAPAKVVPPWASRLLMTVDTQKDHFWFVIRAWGYRFRSQRILHGRVPTFGDLEELFYRAYFPYAGEIYPALRCHMLGIDSGGGIKRVDDFGVDASRTDEVYQFCLDDPTFLKPLKGEGRRPLDQPQRLRKVTYQPPNAKRSPYTVFLNYLDANYYEDVLASYIEQRLPALDPTTGEVRPIDGPDLWALNDVDDDEYNRHMSNVHKVRMRKSGRKGQVDLWLPKTAGARHDLRDCEVYQIALAHGPAQCALLPSPEQIALQVKANQLAAANPPRGITDPHGRPFLATNR